MTKESVDNAKTNVNINSFLTSLEPQNQTSLAQKVKKLTLSTTTKKQQFTAEEKKDLKVLKEEFERNCEKEYVECGKDLLKTVKNIIHSN